MDLLNDISVLFQSRAYPEAAAAALKALDSDGHTGARRALLATLCVSLAASGRQDEAAAAYARVMSEGWPLEDDVDLDAALTAAIAAGQREHTEWLYHARFKHTRYGQGRIAISPTATLEKWCGDNGATFRVVDPALTIDIPSRHPWHYVTEPYIEARIPEAEILSGWDFVVAPTGHVLANSGYMPLSVKFMQFYPQVALDPLGVVAHPWPEDVIEHDCDALFLSAPERFHVGHVIVDFLPRLRSLERLDPQAKIVIPTEAPRKFRDFLSMFGIGRERIIECDLSKRYRFRSLTLANAGDMLRPNPNNVHFIRSVTESKATDRPTNRLFLDRAVGTRQISNMAELSMLLAEFGIQRVNLSRLSIPEQRDLLGRTQLVVGIFGSDMLATYFLPNDAHAVELAIEPAEHPLIGPACHFMGIEHQFLQCPKAPVTQIKRYKKDSDMVVDCAELRAMLEAILKKQDSGP